MVKTEGKKKRIHKRWVRLTEALIVIALFVAAGFYFLDSTNPKGAQDETRQSGIEVKTTPEKATIFLNGKEQKDKSNTTIKADVGKHTVKLVLEGYDTQEVMVEVRENEPAPLEHVFTKGGVTVLNEPGAKGTPQTTYAVDQLETYTNDKYRYTIKYPKGWLADTDPSGVPHFYNQHNAEKAKNDAQAELEESMVILALPNPQKLDPTAWYKARQEYTAEDQSQIKQQARTINGQPAYQYDTPYGFVPTVTTVFTRGDLAFLLQIKSGVPDRKIYDQMVDTFTMRP